MPQPIAESPVPAPQTQSLVTSMPTPQNSPATSPALFLSPQPTPYPVPNVQPAFEPKIGPVPAFDSISRIEPVPVAVVNPIAPQSTNSSDVVAVSGGNSNAAIIGGVVGGIGGILLVGGAAWLLKNFLSTNNRRTPNNFDPIIPDYNGGIIEIDIVPTVQVVTANVGPLHNQPAAHGVLNPDEGPANPVQHKGGHDPAPGGMNQIQADERLGNELVRAEVVQGLDNLVNGRPLCAPGFSSSIAKPHGGFWMEYYVEGIDTILPLRVAGCDAKVLPTVIFDEQAVSLGSEFTQVQGSGTLNIVQPIILKATGKPSHWVCVITQQLQGHRQGQSLITYVDSENSPIPTNLFTALKKFNTGAITQQIVLEQKYTNNCALEMTENIVMVLKGTRVSQDEAPFLHSALLEKHLKITAFEDLLAKYDLQISTKEALTVKGFRQVALKMHPDKGGDLDDFLFAQSVLDDSHEQLPTASAWQRALYKASIGFKTLDTAVDCARLYEEPSYAHLKNLAYDALHLYLMYSGLQGLTAAMSVFSIAEIYHEHGLEASLSAATTALLSIVLPVVLSMNPYAGAAYGAAITTYVGYEAISNAYDFYAQHSIPTISQEIMGNVEGSVSPN